VTAAANSSAPSCIIAKNSAMMLSACMQ